MKKILLAVTIFGLAAASLQNARADHRYVGVRISAPAPVYVAPRCYTPAPVYCPPPVVVYRPAPVYCAPPPVYCPPPVAYCPPRVIVREPTFSFSFGFGGGHHSRHHRW
jgi:hypothetical protein